MKVLVTGATGFIGGALLSFLQKMNVEVIALIRNDIDTFSSKYPEVKIISGDLETISTDELNAYNIDTLVHLAWDNVSKVMLDSHFDHLNIQKIFMDKVFNSNISKVIVSGSCFEYGKVEGGIDVSVEPKPSTNYGVAKNELKTWLLNRWLKSNRELNISWMRVFYVYGENQHERSLYSQLMKAVKEERREFDMSRGFQIRDFVKIDNVITDFYEEIILDYPGFKVINVCSGNPISVREFAEKLIADFNVSITLNLGIFKIPEYEPISFWGKKDYKLIYLK
jgi:nucleoside-diphosphate-sugar epimerase